MISEVTANKFCKENIKLIENYDKAIADTENTWHCHHRLEIQGDKIVTVKELEEQGLYWNRPASELIFLPGSEHRKLHGNNRTEEYKAKMSVAHKGEKNYNYGKNLSEEIKAKISEAKKGENNWWYGKRHSEETKRKMSEAQKGKVLSEEHKRKLSESQKGEKSARYGIHHTEESKIKMSKAKKGKYVGEKNHRYGTHHTEESKIKMSEKHKGENNPAYGRHWYNNGITQVYEKECPEGFVKGRLKKVKE